MILMNQGALDALDEQAWDEGFRKGREEGLFEGKLYQAQYKKLCEILEVEGDQSLIDACEHLGQELRAHREASKVATFALEKQRKKIDDQAHQIIQLEQSLNTMGFTNDQLQNEISDLHEQVNIRDAHLAQLEQRKETA